MRNMFNYFNGSGSQPQNQIHQNNFQPQNLDAFVNNSSQVRLFDDDEFVDLQKDFSKGTAYDLSFLCFNAVPEIKKVQRNQQTKIPLLFSVYAEENLNLENAKEKSTRPPIDLILVIDKSGSMQGEKTELVKSTLEYLITLLNDNDRLSLILFDSSVYRQTPLQRMTNENKVKLGSLVKNISAGGGTNITYGMDFALSTIKDRKVKNPLTSVFLLSDGLDGGAEQKFKALLEKSKIEDNFTIQSFGFGSDHDPALMTSIANTKGGNFYFVQTLSSLDECFVNAFAGLISVAAQNVSFNVSMCKDSSNVSVAKTYGNWKTFPADNFFQYQINYLMAGVSKEYVMVIDLPVINQIGIHKIANCVFEAESTDGKNKTQSSKEIFIEIVDNEEEVKSQEPDRNVKLNVMRLRGADILTEARELADQELFEKAKVLIDGFVAELIASNLEKDDSIAQLIKDLQIAHGNMHAVQYRQFGKHQMMECEGAFREKKARKDVNLYSNNCQMVMKTNLLAMKK